MQVKDVMTEEVYTLYTMQTLDLARTLMNAKHIRHIPIVDEKTQFVGLLSHRDVLSLTISRLAGIDEAEQDELDHHIPIKEVMKTDIATVDPNSDLCAAVKVLLDNKYGCLPVIHEKQLVGILTEADFLQLTLDLLEQGKIC